MTDEQRKVIVVGSRLARRHDLRFEARLHPDNVGIVHVGSKDEALEAARTSPPALTRIVVVSQLTEYAEIGMILNKYKSINITQISAFLEWRAT